MRHAVAAALTAMGLAAVMWVPARTQPADVLDAFSSDSTLGAATGGGGVLIRVRPRFALNVDARYLRSQFRDPNAASFDEQFVSYTRIAGGAVFRF